MGHDSVVQQSWDFITSPFKSPGDPAAPINPATTNPTPSIQQSNVTTEQQQLQQEGQEASASTLLTGGQGVKTPATTAQTASQALVGM